jgi:hypothetical protein
MNDDQLISKQLDKNFLVCTDNSWLSVLEKGTEKRINLTAFSHDFYNIFGDFTTDAGEGSISIFNRWFKRNQEELIKPLTEFLNKIDGTEKIKDLCETGVDSLSSELLSKEYIKKKIRDYCYDIFLTPKVNEYLVSVNREIGIVDLLNDFNMKFSDGLQHFNTLLSDRVKKYYFDSLLNTRIDTYLSGLDLSLDSNFLNIGYEKHFIDDLFHFKSKMVVKFNDYYCDKVVMPVLDGYVKTLQKKIDSGTLIDDLTSKLELSGKFYSDYAVNYVNKWYSNTVIGVKMQDLLSQLVITPVKNDWRVTWIGHGKVDRNTILAQFRQENGYQHTFLTGMYDEWYAEEIVNASERLAKSTSAARLPRVVDNQQNILNILND